MKEMSSVTQNRCCHNPSAVPVRPRQEVATPAGCMFVRDGNVPRAAGWRMESNMGTAKQVTTIDSLEDFVKAIKGIRPKKDCVMFFRGHSDRNKYTLQPAVYREPEFIENEPTMISESLARSPDDFSSDSNFFEQLVRLQHYGLPTRLLDVTFNAFAALYFACRHKEKTEGEVIVFQIPRDNLKFFDSDTVALLAALARRPIHFDLASLPDDFDTFNKENEVLRLVHDIANDKPGFQPLVKKDDLRRILCVQPRLSNRRLARQEGAFLLFGTNGKKTDCPIVPDGWITRGPGNKRIVFTCKHYLKSQLAKFGVAEHTLFPELEKQTEHILSRYKGKYKRN